MIVLGMYLLKESSAPRLRCAFARDGPKEVILMSNWPRYPTLYEINIWVWLSELSLKTATSVDVSTVPSAEWDAIAKFGFDARVVKKLERLEMAWLRICTDSLFDWASPTQEQRLQSCFHELLDYRGIRDALDAPARLCHRNSESRTSVAKRISGGGEPDPVRSDPGSAAAFGRRKGDTGRDRSPPGPEGTGGRGGNSQARYDSGLVSKAHREQV